MPSKPPPSKPDSFDNILDKLKSHLFQPLLTVLVGIATFYISQMRSDLQQALIQINVDKTRIDNLERIIYQKGLHAGIINTSASPWNDRELPVYFKPEEEFDITKHLKPPYKTSI